MSGHVWVMALGDGVESRGPVNIEDTPPWRARASVVVDDFAQLFPVLVGWRQHFGPSVVAYVMRTLGDGGRQPAPGWEKQWCEEGAPYRLCVLPGGYIKVSDYSEARSSGRPPDLDRGIGRPASEIDR